MWDNKNQTLVVGYHLIAETLSKIHILETTLIMTPIVHIVQHIMLGKVANNNIMQVVIVLPNKKV